MGRLCVDQNLHVALGGGGALVKILKRFPFFPGSHSLFQPTE